MRGRARRLPRVEHRVVNISVRSSLVPWWEDEVEPTIARLKTTRTAFVMEAVRRYMREINGEGER